MMKNNLLNFTKSLNKIFNFKSSTNFSSIETPPIKDDLDFFDDSQSSNNNNNNNNVKPFGFNELLICKHFKRSDPNQKHFKMTCRMFKLETNKIFKNNVFQIFHEHLIAKSKHNVAKNNDNIVNYNMYSNWISFKRPTLYEYIILKEQLAVSSHFSILSLVPMLLEIKNDSRMLECGTGAASMTLFLRYIYILKLYSDSIKMSLTYSY